MELTSWCYNTPTSFLQFEALLCFPPKFPLFSHLGFIIHPYLDSLGLYSYLTLFLASTNKFVFFFPSVSWLLWKGSLFVLSNRFSPGWGFKTFSDYEKLSHAPLQSVSPLIHPALSNHYLLSDTWVSFTCPRNPYKRNRRAYALLCLAFFHYVWHLYQQFISFYYRVVLHCTDTSLFIHFYSSMVGHLDFF